jgi:hypothetical protein
MRSELLAQITTNVAGSHISVSQELPWNSGGQVLYLKNKKHFYLDEEQEITEEFIKTLDKQNVEQQTITLNGYLTVDAKNQPGDIANVVANIVAANSIISTTIDNRVDVTTEIENDDITYTFEYNFITII